MEERNTLLIVDDFEFNRLMLSDTFSDRRVVEAENGKRAIEEFEKNKDKLCAVLLDIMMPVMDGFGVLEYLVDNKYIDDIPVFIISADTSAHGVEKVIFKKLSHKGENKRGQLTATLELWEYIPQTITAKSSSSSGSGKSGGGAASNLKADYKSYLSNERGKSPARDDADATAAMNKVTAMPY